MSDSKLFTPIQVGHVTLQHRIAMAPLTRYRADSNYIPHSFVKEYYEQRASVPGTLLVTEATFISPQAGGYTNAPGIYNAAQIAAWKEITTAVHARGSFIFCQLWALGRVATSSVLQAQGFDVVSSSHVPNPTNPDAATPRPLTEAEIQEYIQWYAQAAKNAIEAGFDGVEIHGANGYLIDQFTKGNCNKRTDAWGGSVEKRSRLAIEVVKVVINAVGAQRTAIRLSPFNYNQGMQLNEIKEQFSPLVSSLKPLKLAYLHLTDSLQPGENLHFLTEIWGKTTPVLIAGALKRDEEGDPNERAWKAVERQAKYSVCDVVVVHGRYFISNPDLPYRLKNKVGVREYDSSTFYKKEVREGYTDYPFSEEFQRDILAQAA